MRRLLAITSFILFFILSPSAQALLSLELTRGVAGAIPISILPFSVTGETPSQDVATITSSDLQNSGRFQVSHSKDNSSDNVVTGKVESLGDNRFNVSFQLSEGFHSKTNAGNSVILSQKFTVSSNELRPLAHHISDMIFQKITGVRGVFSTRLAYVVVQREAGSPNRYILEVADQDGYNPKPLLTSTDPIMSPSWSKNGKQIAYVSFEKKHAAIYIQDILSGSRHLVSEFPGINGAPAWSPDGRKLALVLSKTRSPNIYVLDLNTKQLSQLTNDYYINTEPSFAPDGRSLLFTSNRSGNPQVYQINLDSHAVSRVTYDGNYNARPSFTPDGKHIVVLNRQSGLYNIGILDLDTGSFRVLTNSSHQDHGSPSIAPNGSMIVFEAFDSGRNVLGMVTTDSNVTLRLPGRNGEVQDPAWSPFLS